MNYMCYHHSIHCYTPTCSSPQGGHPQAKEKHGFRIKNISLELSKPEENTETVLRRNKMWQLEVRKYISRYLYSLY